MLLVDRKPFGLTTNENSGQEDSGLTNVRQGETRHKLPNLPAVEEQWGNKDVVDFRRTAKKNRGAFLKELSQVIRKLEEII